MSQAFVGNYGMFMGFVLSVLTSKYFQTKMRVFFLGGSSIMIFQDWLGVGAAGKVYVSPKGEDSPTCGLDPLSPCRTFGQAVNFTSDGDILCAETGTFSCEGLTVKHNLNLRPYSLSEECFLSRPKQNISTKASQKVVLDCNGVENAFAFENVNNISIAGFEFLSARGSAVTISLDERKPFSTYVSIHGVAFRNNTVTAAFRYGGGLQILAKSPIVGANIIFEDVHFVGSSLVGDSSNSAFKIAFGGKVSTSRVSFYRCRIVDTVKSRFGVGAISFYGGFSNAEILFDACEISDNRGGGWGAGIAVENMDGAIPPNYRYEWKGLVVSVHKCIFARNKGSTAGAFRMWIQAGEGIVTNITHSLFLDNGGDPSSSKGISSINGAAVFIQNPIALRVGPFIGGSTPPMQCGGRQYKLTGEAIFDSCIFRGNTALNVQGNSNGAALYFINGKARVNNCSFVDNQVAGLGGAVYVDSNANLIVYRSVFSGNSAGLGGDIYALSSRVEVNETTIFMQKATGAAGSTAMSIHIADGMEILFGNTFKASCPSGNMLQHPSIPQNYLYRSSCDFYPQQRLQIGCTACLPGRFSLLGGNISGASSGSVSKLPTSQIRCLPCPQFANCEAGQANITALPGYWGLTFAAHSVRDDEFGDEQRVYMMKAPYGYTTTDPKTISDCISSRAGQLCGECEDGYSQKLGSVGCSRDETCHDLIWFVPLSMLILVLVVGYFSVCSPTHDSLVDIVVLYYQGTSMILGKTISSSWRAPLLEVANLRFGGGPQGVCLTPGATTLSAQFFGFIGPLGLAIGLGVLCISLKLKNSFPKIPRCFPESSAVVFTSSCTRLSASWNRESFVPLVCTKLLFYSLNSLSRTAGRLLTCVEIPGGVGLVLFRSGTVKCYQWWQFLMMGLLAMLTLFPFALALFVCNRAKRAPRRVFAGAGRQQVQGLDNSFRATVFIFLTSPYRRDSFITTIWTPCLLTQYLLLTLFSVYTFQHPSAGAIIQSMICTLMLFAHSITRPYRVQFVNLVQTCLLSSLVLFSASNIHRASMLGNKLAVEVAWVPFIEFFLLLWPLVAVVLHKIRQKTCAKKCMHSQTASHALPKAISLQHSSPFASFSEGLLADDIKS